MAQLSVRASLLCAALLIAAGCGVSDDLPAEQPQLGNEKQEIIGGSLDTGDPAISA